MNPERPIERYLADQSRRIDLQPASIDAIAGRVRTRRRRRTVARAGIVAAVLAVAGAGVGFSASTSNDPSVQIAAAGTTSDDAAAPSTSVASSPTLTPLERLGPESRRGAEFFIACYARHGITMTVVDDPEVTFSEDGGYSVEYADGDEQRPDFQAISDQCYVEFAQTEPGS